MKIKISIVLLGIIFSVSAQDLPTEDRLINRSFKDHSTRSLDYFAGKYWNGMNLWPDFYCKISKMVIINSMFQTAAIVDTLHRHSLAYHSTYETIIKGMDSFYQDYRNEAIPIFLALSIVSDEIMGRPQNEINRIVERYRRVLNQDNENDRN